MGENIYKFEEEYHFYQMDGLIEVVNKTIIQLLRFYCDKNSNTWNEHLVYAQHVYNKEIHTLISKLPFEINFGYLPPSPFECTFGK